MKHIDIRITQNAINWSISVNEITASKICEEKLHILFK